MPGIYRQKGPRSHHFAAAVSFAVGVSVAFEFYASNVVFSSLDNPIMSGQMVWGLLFMGLGLLLFQGWSIILRAAVEIALCSIWTVFGLYSLYFSLLSPQFSHQAGSVFGILAIAMAIVCLLATSNLKRDFYLTDKNWLKENLHTKIVDPFRPKRGDSDRER